MCTSSEQERRAVFREVQLEHEIVRTHVNLLQCLVGMERMARGYKVSAKVNPFGDVMAILHRR